MTSELHLPLLFRLYVWSVVLEPLLFFVVGHRSVTGVTANVSRILQLVVLLGILYAASTATFSRRRTHPLHRYYAYYTAYFLLACVSGVYGYAAGAYHVPLAYHSDVSGFAALLNSSWVRPLFEYGIAFYYFVYFTVIPQFFLTSRARVEYFFRSFFYMFNATLALGFIDVLLAPTGFVFLGRHLFDWIGVGGRFHGLAGEPRDAFVYLVFGVAIYFLRCHVAGTSPRRSWIAVVALAAVLTQSASGLLGVAIFLVLFMLMGIVSLKKSAVVAALIAVVVLVPAIHLMIENTERLVVYKDVLLVIWEILERHEDIPSVLTGQVNNIYPVYHMISRIRDLDLIPLVIGFGFGSASAINNVMGSWDELANPNSMLIRLIVESGLAGSALFVLAFYKPMELLTSGLPAHTQRTLLLLTLLVVGAFLGHRNASLYIFLGISIATLRDARSSVRGAQQQEVRPPASAVAAARP